MIHSFVRRQRQLRTADDGPESVAVVPWHAHTAIWGAIFPPADSGSGDCTHTYCYTPYYFAPLWDGWATALRAQVEAGSTATAEPATHRGRHESDMEHQHAHEPERGGRGHQNDEKNPLEEATFLQSFASLQQKLACDRENGLAPGMFVIVCNLH